MGNPSATHQLVCGIVQRYPKAAIALAEAAGVPLPDYDDVQAAPDARQLRDGTVIHTDATIRLLRDGKAVYFATVEMQQEYRREKYLALHPYHAGAALAADAGGHVFVLSIEPSQTEGFRREDARRRAELAFSASFHHGGHDGGLDRLEQDKSAALRALPVVLRDLTRDIPRTQQILGELTDSDPMLAELYTRAIVERVPNQMLGELLQPDMLAKLRTLEWFRDYEAEAEAKGEAKSKARVAAAEVKAAMAELHAIQVAAAALRDCLIIRGDKPTEYAISKINACTDEGMLSAWLRRAYQGETSAQLFPEPEPADRVADHP
jgi:hypothetical protein